MVNIVSAKNHQSTLNFGGKFWYWSNTSGLVSPSDCLSVAREKKKDNYPVQKLSRSLPGDQNEQHQRERVDTVWSPDVDLAKDKPRQPSAQLSGYNFHLLTRNSRQRGMFYFFKVEDWCSSWSSNILATWCEELTHWKRPWCWERLKAGGEGDGRGRDGWMASPSWLSEHEFEQIPG